MPRLSEDAVLHDGCTLTDTTSAAMSRSARARGSPIPPSATIPTATGFCDIANADVGKFANIASLVRIGATDHPLDRASLHHFMYRSALYWDDAEDDADWFAQRRRGAPPSATTPGSATPRR
jgi:hypothetical protein